MGMSVQDTKKEIQMKIASCIKPKEDAEICKKCIRNMGGAVLVNPQKFKVQPNEVHDYKCDGYINRKEGSLFDRKL